MASDSFTFEPAALRRLAAQIFEAAGTPADVAELVADALVDANLAGHDSHGVQQILRYVPRIRNGELRPAERPKFLVDRGATALLSGEWGFGQAAGRMAIDSAIERARVHGVSAIGLVRISHLGRMGDYPERAARAGCIAHTWAGGFGGEFKAAPFGGAGRLFGTNPLSAGFPIPDSDPIVVDFATTAVAGGKVLLARASGTQLPPGSIVDRDGRPSIDPADYDAGGSMLPFGGHKGYALAVLVELLGTALTGSDRFADEGPGGETLGRSGALFVVLDAGVFRPAEETLAAAERVVERIRAIPPAPGFDRVMTPGEPESSARSARLAGGIKVPAETWTRIGAIAESLGVSLDAAQPK